MSDPIQILQILLISCGLAFIWAPFLIRFLYRYKIVRLVDADYTEIIESRRLKQGTPIMGGLLVVITVLGLNLLFNFEGDTKVPLLVFFVAALLGGFDDLLNIFGRERPVRSVKRTLKLIRVHKDRSSRLRLLLTLPWQAYKRVFFLLGSNPGKGIQAHEKIIIQTICGIVVAWWLYFRLGWDTIWVPFGGEIKLGLLMPLFIIFLVVGLANAVNFTDGMDGLASGNLIFAYIAFLVIAIIERDFSIAFLEATVVGALIAYLYYNIPPARFQMGDVGSLALGTLLASLALVQDRAVLLFVVGGVFFIELGSTVLQGLSRRFLGRRILKMAPIHHHFEILGWSEEKIVMRFWLFGIILAVLGIYLAFV